ncbi:hypothetical protein DFA_05119 [Cavenderia fasciculata]|uniref:Uncharacterized protein n=1 Tax=Cavenderia fasciculata TaxID=261658 RepID=F4PND6_CACFS|nr:uncharacterized protein DFA_05119 [Cavenderia fasciculata]EGG22989.1 hypothetical protein DFA_05119 [Cavenderia fasciculata]|eukprot:XP_004360840.1 hypothetical protein DFA_05119 [Cavenderia fasciculata]
MQLSSTCNNSNNNNNNNNNGRVIDPKNTLGNMDFNYQSENEKKKYVTPRQN